MPGSAGSAASTEAGPERPEAVSSSGSAEGGGIDAYGGSLQVTGSTFSNNVAQAAAGAAGLPVAGRGGAGWFGRRRRALLQRQ